MGLFNSISERLFGKSRASTPEAFFRMFTGYIPVFTNAPEGLYEMELVRAAIHSFASFCSKLKPEIRGAALPHLERQWQVRINPLMETSKFIYRLATIFSVNNNAFIVPLENESGGIVGYWPLLPQNCEVMEMDGVFYLRYFFSNGQKAAIEFSRVGILTQHQYTDDFFGESNSAIKPTMQLIHTNNQGIINSVNASAQIRFIGKIDNIIDEDDIRAARERFAEDNLSADNKSGFLLYDRKFSDVQQVKSNNITINAPQMKQIAENVFHYFGTNEAILQNKYDEEGFNAYFEGKIAPFANQLSLVLSGMTFSPRELAHGNEIMLTSNRLEHASHKTKLQLSTTGFDRGQFTRNEVRGMFGMPRIDDPDADKFFIRSEYTRLEDLGKALQVEAAKEGVDLKDPQQTTESPDAGTGGAHTEAKPPPQ